MLSYRVNGREQPLESSCGIALRAGEGIHFDLASGGRWYGHGFNHDQPYPLESGRIVNEAFAVNNIQSPIWMCSAGVAILADTTGILDVRLNQDDDGQLRIRSPEAPLELRIFHARALPEAHAALVRHLGRPSSTPAPELFGDCLFNTWTQFPRCITGERVLGMAREIRGHDYPCSTLMIDDRWESCFGELRFSADFPDPKGMVDELHTMGFAVWLWVTPFVNREASGFEDLASAGVLVRDREGQGAAPLRWWGGHGGLVDLTGPAGREWYAQRLRHLRDAVGIDGFKIDGGDFKYQPAPERAVWHADPGPSGYVDTLLGLFEDIVPGQCEARTAWRSQHRNVLWRLGGKDSHWGQDNGLKALVSLGLHTALVGYDRLIPDMVPGRVRTLVSDAPLPTDELMIRWTETSALMPLLQFSYYPWNYASRTERAVGAYARLHQRLGPYIAEQATACAPLLRPIWYDTPDVPELYGIANEFMLGPDLLAAPVMDPGVTARDVLLPPGAWRDAWTGRACDGGPIASHPAPCPGMPVFVRADNDDLFGVVHESLGRIGRGTVASGVTTATCAAGLDRDLDVTG